ncbi:peptidyl-prolyl cis-trans isomerase FKBP8-like [Dermacentor andersoni]|uniref:peptidyl-prolyl cis-trans isomerase FKBP8-like n=1 Tax=Dermacentor andersoni TaxID=34620 RepID=UPI0021553E76|nr:peptidyl-prolyl cis-trans isomerase FKBP8-like [Dermacentor andersoni]
MPVITEVTGNEDVPLRVGPMGDGPDVPAAEVVKGDGSSDPSQLPGGSRARKVDGSGDDDDDGDSSSADMPPLESFDVDEKSSTDKKAKKEKKIVIEDEEPEKEVDEDGWLDVLGSGELKKRVIKPGLGKDSRPQRCNWVVLNVKGTLDDGTVFEEHKDWRIILGDMETVCGLDITLALMEKGEVAEIVVPARLGYGDQGREPDVPPKARLHFHVELLDTYPAKEETDLPFQERLSIGDAKRERGNFWYSRGDYSNAAHCYRRALDFLDDMGLNLSESPADLQLLLDTRLKVYNNLTATQMKMEAYEAALKSVDFVLKVQPNNFKALYRKGKILAGQGNVSEAVSTFKKALKLEPDNKVIQQELSRLMVRKEKEDRAEKAMYKRMFGGSNTTTNAKESSKGSRFGKIRNWTLVMGSAVVAAAAIGVAAYRHLGAV